MKSLRRLTFVTLALCFALTTCSHNLWPWPQSYTSGKEVVPMTDPCNFQFALQGQDTANEDVKEVTEMYRKLIFARFECSSFDYFLARFFESGPTDVLEIIIDNVEEMQMNMDTDESYNLEISTAALTLTAKNYVGFLRGIETFSQLVEIQNDTSGKAQDAYIRDAPISINDAPRYPHRGFMLDTSRHFISKDSILRMIDSLMFTKLNVLHWHITDSDSFPMYMPSHPEMSQYGAFTPEETYTATDVAEIVQYALKRGVRLIPELDAPAHMLSWSKNPAFNKMVECQTVWYTGTPLGQINPILDESYDMLKDLLADLASYFPWEYQHLGADEVFEQCWQDESIQTFIKEQDLQDWKGLFNYFVDREFGLKPADRTAIFWLNMATSYLKFPKDSVIQFWGVSTDMKALMEQYKDHKWIISAYDYLYLDCGMGNYFGNKSWCDYHTWKDIYYFESEDFTDYPENILGAEAALWGELDSDLMMDRKSFPRIAAMAERVWSPKDNPNNDTYSVFTRLDSWVDRAVSRGIAAEPVSSEYCSRNPKMCFPPSDDL